jgi:hypothetical protein
MGYYIATAETSGQMADEGRALLTEAEREILSGERDVSDNYEYKIRSLVRNRIRKRFRTDVEILKTEFPEVYRMIETEVCDRMNESSDENT